MKKFELSEVQDSINRLESSGFQGILVGGHAVSFWANHYRKDLPAWNELMPYTSEDIDFLGGRVEALLCKKLFGGKSNLNDGTDPSPQAGVILAPIGGQIIRIDIITSIIGVDSYDAAKQAISLAEKRDIGTPLRVLHPLHCLFGKTAALAQLPQGGRQDLKHLKLSVLFVKEYILEKLGEPRVCLNITERMFALAMNELGLRVWHLHKVSIENSLPLEAFALEADERLQKFTTIRLPQLVSRLAEARERYENSLLET